jgi:transposase
MGHRVRTRRIAAGALASVTEAIADTKKMFGLAADARVISCYEAGREGFWLHRYLTGRGATNYVVDSASIEVDRRARRTKTDAVDLRGLLALLARYVVGDRRCWRWCGFQVWRRKTRDSYTGRGKRCRGIGRA